MWKHLIIARFLLVFLPLTGYIHPDEFFQGPEVAAGDFLNYDVHRTWEFKGRAIRSTLSVHAPNTIYLFLRWLSEYNGFQITPYVLLIAPRLVMALISLINDICVYKISKKMGQDPEINLFIHTSSYIALCLYTKTLSNNLEAAFFSLFLYYAVSIRYTDANIRNSETYSEWKKPRISIMGILLGLGFYNRPTFLFYAFIPLVVVFFFSGQFYNHFSNLVCPGIFVAMLMTIIDTLYYSKLTLHVALVHIFDLEYFLNLIIVAPINFLYYNIQHKNVAVHGVHMAFMHFLVNIPVLFGILGIAALIDLFLTAGKLVVLSNFEDMNEGSRKNFFFLLAWLFPTVGLSLSPHQEMRFLIPLLVPLVILYGNTVYRIVLLKSFWLTLNVFGVIFFGYLHQGGLLPCIFDLSKMIKNSENSVEIIFYHTYMPPRFLLQLPKDDDKVFITDLAGGKLDLLINTLQKSVNESDGKDVYIVLPGSLSSYVRFIHKNVQFGKETKFNIVQSYFAHLSTENLPDFSKVYECYSLNCDWKIVLMHQLSLKLYKLQIG